MSSWISGVWLIVAAAFFWLSWILMPGVGVTDTATIFALVAEHRPNVYASVVLQLASAAAYAPGLLGSLAAQKERPHKALLAGASLILIGAMGSAADAVFHLIAYEMTAPGVPLDAVGPVMRRLQGPDLALLLPFVLAFFLGHALFVGSLRRRGRLAGVGARVLLAALAVVAVGAPATRFGLVSGRLVGLGFLGAISGSLLMLGLSFAIERDIARFRTATSTNESEG